MHAFENSYIVTLNLFILLELISKLLIETLMHLHQQIDHNQAVLARKIIEMSPNIVISNRRPLIKH